MTRSLGSQTSRVARASAMLHASELQTSTRMKSSFRFVCCRNVVKVRSTAGTNSAQVTFSRLSSPYNPLGLSRSYIGQMTNFDPEHNVRIRSELNTSNEKLA